MGKHSSDHESKPSDNYQGKHRADMDARTAHLRRETHNDKGQVTGWFVGRDVKSDDYTDR